MGSSANVIVSGSLQVDAVAIPARASLTIKENAIEIAIVRQQTGKVIFAPIVFTCVDGHRQQILDLVASVLDESETEGRRLARERVVRAADQYASAQRELVAAVRVSQALALIRDDRLAERIVDTIEQSSTADDLSPDLLAELARLAETDGHR